MSEKAKDVSKQEEGAAKKEEAEDKEKKKKEKKEKHRVTGRPRGYIRGKVSKPVKDFLKTPVNEYDPSIKKPPEHPVGWPFDNSSASTKPEASPPKPAQQPHSPSSSGQAKPQPEASPPKPAQQPQPQQSNPPAPPSQQPASPVQLTPAPAAPHQQPASPATQPASPVGEKEPVAGIICGSCEDGQAAIKFCKDCPAPLCAECVENHSRLKITKTHQIVELPEEVCESCDDKDRATSYCNDCSANLCESCVNAHKKLKITKDHAIISLTAKLIAATAPSGAEKEN